MEELRRLKGELPDWSRIGEMTELQKFAWCSRSAAPRWQAHARRPCCDPLTNLVPCCNTFNSTLMQHTGEQGKLGHLLAHIAQHRLPFLPPAYAPC